jgi:hypothetical protein
MKDTSDKTGEMMKKTSDTFKEMGEKIVDKLEETKKAAAAAAPAIINAGGGSSSSGMSPIPTTKTNGVDKSRNFYINSRPMMLGF